MKNSHKIALTISSLSMLILGTQAVTAASVDGDASATVVSGIAISQNTALSFGNFAAGTGGTVVIGTDGARSQTGAVSLSTVDAGSQGIFDVTGEGNATFAITLPANATLTSGANTMTVDTFTSDPSGTGTLSSGSASINVGATLTVADSQAAGSYSGTYTVSVDYN